MIPQELLKHLKTAGDSTHAAIFLYLQQLNSFNRGHAIQDGKGRGEGGGGGGGSCRIRQQ